MKSSRNYAEPMKASRQYVRVFMGPRAANLAAHQMKERSWLPLLKEEGWMRPSIVRMGADGVVSRGPYLNVFSATTLNDHPVCGWV
jgi:hypothetical protein